MAKAKSSSTAKSKLSIDLDEIKKATLVLRSLNHKMRQNMLNLIHDKGEIMVTDIYKKLKLEQSLTSSYLAMLRKANAVKTRREGQVIYYSVNYQHLSEVERGAKVITG